MAFCVIQNRKIIDCGFINDTVYDLKTEVLLPLTKKFFEVIDNLIKTYRPKVIIAERFMVRSAMMGASAEKISFMLGIIGLLCLDYKIKFELITSALWKNRFNREQNKLALNTIYKEHKKIMAPHLIDAAFIGYYIIDSYSDTTVIKTLKHLRRAWIRSTNVQQKR
jgi:hypothetical protein